jgi:hypothetical protein
MSWRVKGIAAIAMGLASLIKADGQGPSVGTRADTLATTGDAQVLVGTIETGDWETHLTIGNADAQAASAYVSYDPNVMSVCPPLVGCFQSVFINLPSNGTAQMQSPVSGIGTTYVVSPTGGAPPPLSARTGGVGGTSVGVDIPVARLSTILAQNPTQLSFPGAIQGNGSRTNLALVNAQQIPPPTLRGYEVQLRIEAFASDGTLVGSMTTKIDYGDTAYFVQILESMGVSNLESGQIRVTKTGGFGVFWGVMYTVYPSGAISAVPGN